MRFKLIVAAIVLVFIGVVAAASAIGPRAGIERDKTNHIAVSEEMYDFGEISMKDGNVVYNYTIKNTSDKTVNIKKVHTSCACTEVTLTLANEAFGPYGMEGHGGTVPLIEVPFGPGQEANVMVEFDPAAHGAAGVGQVERIIYVDTLEGARSQAKFKAMVRP